MNTQQKHKHLYMKPFSEPIQTSATPLIPKHRTCLWDVLGRSWKVWGTCLRCFWGGSLDSFGRLWGLCWDALVSSLKAWGHETTYNKHCVSTKTDSNLLQTKIVWRLGCITTLRKQHSTRMELWEAAMRGAVQRTKLDASSVYAPLPGHSLTIVKSR